MARLDRCAAHGSARPAPPVFGAARIAQMPNTPTELDASGLRCPMPLLKAKRALNALDGGERLRVVATDPGSVRDFEVFAAQSGHKLLESRQDGARYHYLLEKKR